MAVTLEDAPPAIAFCKGGGCAELYAEYTNQCLHRVWPMITHVLVRATECWSRSSARVIDQRKGDHGRSLCFIRTLSGETVKTTRLIVLHQEISVRTQLQTEPRGNASGSRFTKGRFRCPLLCSTGL